MANRTGEQLANYRIIRLIGRGGFAEVYLAEHLYLRTQVAIKILNTQLTNEDMEGFLHEARTIAYLVHPHIVRVLDFGTHGETPFLVMDYAPNGTLRQRHPKGTKPPLPTIVGYVKQIASALQYAHDQKLMHRDIKPENILLGRNDELLLSDFGIALIARSSLSQSTQEVVGTVAYMAPEQVQGKPRPASDQYALAVVVYEWLCGGKPFHGTLTEIATQQVLAAPPSLHEKAPDIPPAVEHVIMTALAKDPKQRFSTIQDFANALDEASQPVPATVEAFAYRGGPPLPKTLVLSSGNKAANTANSMTIGSKHSSITSPDKEAGMKSSEEKLKIWHIGKRQVSSLALGVLLYTILSNFMILIHLHPSNGFEVLWILPALVIPLFFAVLYGPWVGLVTGGLGYFLGNYLSIAINWNTNANSIISFVTLYAIKPPWYFHLAFLLMGFIAGLSTLFTKGHYKTIRNIALAEIFATLAILCGFFTIFNSLWPHLYPNESVWTDFTHIALPNIMLVLILLPIMLSIRNLISKGKTPGLFQNHW